MIYIILALLFYTGALMFGAISSRNLNTNLVSAITNLVSAILPIMIAIPLFNKKVFEGGKFGILMAVIGGILVAFFALAINKSFTVNKIAIVTPIVFGGSIFLSSILSMFLFKEKISTVQGWGLALLGIGLLMIVYAKATGR